MARAIVTTAGSPSGIAPTAKAIAKIKLSLSASNNNNPCPNARYVPITIIIAVIATIPMVKYLPITPNFFVNGVSKSTVSLSMSDILPSSVSIPVFTTTAVAVPETTKVPLYTIHFLSPITASGLTASVVF